MLPNSKEKKKGQEINKNSILYFYVYVIFCYSVTTLDTFLALYISVYMRIRAL